MSNDSIERELEVLESEEREENSRKRLLVLLLLLLLLLCYAVGLFLRYLANPAPLPELLPGPMGDAVSYPPHYLFSIYKVDKPVGVTASSNGERIYASESGGELTVKIFDRDGDLINNFVPPGTTSLDRAPVYLTLDTQGAVYVTDRMQNAIFVYNADGDYLDSILSPDLTLSQYLNQHMNGALPEGTTFYYNEFSGMVILTQPGQTEPQALPAPDLTPWDPLGVRFDQNGNLLVTVVTNHTVRIFPDFAVDSSPLLDFKPQTLSFGGYGQEAGQLLFPNIAVVDSRGRIYVTDGNNGRVSAWDQTGTYLFDFAKGTGESALNLPRGAFIDGRDRLYVVDAVGQTVRVYDVSKDTPEFLFTFGDFGVDDGMFNYPNDIFVDDTGRIYIADRENNRVQVWSY